MTAKVPEITPALAPNNTSLELSILAILYEDKRFLLKYSKYLKATYFSSQVFGYLYSLVHEFYLQFKRIPNITEAKAEVVRFYYDDSQKDILNKVLEVIDVVYATEANPDYVNQNILEFIKKAEIYNLIVECNNNFEQIDIEEVSSEIKRLQTLTLDDDDFGISSGDFISHLLNREDDTLGVPTGFPYFDAAIRGGFRAGELVIFLAPTNRGKTATLVNIGRGMVSAGYSVAHISLEMNYESMVDRYISSMTGIRINDLPDMNLKKLSEMLSTYNIFTNKDVTIKYFSPHTATVGDIEVYLESLRVQGKKIDAVVLDYADLLKPAKVRKEKRHELGEVHVELKQLGDKFEVPIITASQTNRAGELMNTDKHTLRSTKALSVAHIAEDWSKAGLADYIFGLRQPLKTTSLEDGEQLLILDALKSRFGIRGEKCVFIMNFAKCRMYDLDPYGVDWLAIDTETQEQGDADITFEEL